jgi:hypothetical protein
MEQWRRVPSILIGAGLPGTPRACRVSRGRRRFPSTGRERNTERSGTMEKWRETVNHLVDWRRHIPTGLIQRPGRCSAGLGWKWMHRNLWGRPSPEAARTARPRQYVAMSAESPRMATTTETTEAHWFGNHVPQTRHGAPRAQSILSRDNADAVALVARAISYLRAHSESGASQRVGGLDEV